MKNYSSYYIKGMEHCRNGNFEAGIEDFNKALSLNPTHTESLYNRAKAKFKLKRFDDCINDFALAINVSPENPILFSERAVVYYHKGEVGNALLDLDTAVQLEPGNAYRYASRAYIKDKAGDFQGAIHDYNKAIALDPEDAISYNNRGLVEEKLGYHNRSKASFKKADKLAGVKQQDQEDLVPSIDKKTTGPSMEAKRKNLYPIKDYYKWSKEIFTTKQGFKDFLSFTIDIFRKNRL